MLIERNTYLEEKKRVKMGTNLSKLKEELQQLLKTKHEQNFGQVTQLHHHEEKHNTN